MSPLVAGLDLSMTATGAAWPGGVVETIKPRSSGDLRLQELAHRVGERVEGLDLVVIEGFLNHSHSAGITGMVHGAVRLELMKRGIKFATLPPSSLKKFATGRGGASKTDMAMAAYKRAEAEFRDDNACDAWWLRVAGLVHLDAPPFALPKGQVEALDKLKMEV